MLNTATLFAFLLSAIKILFGQQQDLGDQSFYREDQFYFGISLIILQSPEANFMPRGLSSHFQAGFIRDIPLIKTGKLSVGLGMGYAKSHYHSNLKYVQEEGEAAFFILPNQEEDNKKSRISSDSIEFPIAVRWRNSSASTTAFWRIYSGLKVRWNVASKVVDAAKKKSINNLVAPLSFEPFINFGYNTWNFHLAYQLNSLLRSSLVPPIDLKFFKVGLIFYLL